jgi:catechol 2,3-dioxygenase-like lactoylglutathione lyase family enzyme
MKPKFTGGRNLALKVPPHQYERTVHFYRDVLGLEPLEDHPPQVGFAFGANQLWIDRAPGMSQAELWLEVLTDDVPAAAAHFREAGIDRRDEIEPLPDGHEGFWICDPASMILHLGAERAAW